MDPTAIIVWLVVGAVAGWLAGQIVKGHGFGLVGNIVVGIVGAFIAGWLLPSLGLGLTGIVGSIIYAAIGAIILLFIIGLFKRAA
ncbi:MAG: GlsB/YeaQ/YmgE family stress response membrane protein [Dokdonella sp.]